MPYFVTGQFIKAQSERLARKIRYRRALAKCRRLARRRGIEASWDKFSLMPWTAADVGPGALLTDLVVGDRWRGEASTGAAVAGTPASRWAGGIHFGMRSD